MSVDVEYEGLTEFSKELLDLANDKFPKETRKFLQRAGNKLRKNAKDNYKKGTTTGTKNLIKGLKRDRACKKYCSACMASGAWSCYVGA